MATIEGCYLDVTRDVQFIKFTIKNCVITLHFPMYSDKYMLLRKFYSAWNIEIVGGDIFSREFKHAFKDCNLYQNIIKESWRRS